MFVQADVDLPVQKVRPILAGEASMFEDAYQDTTPAGHFARSPIAVESDSRKDASRAAINLTRCQTPVAACRCDIARCVALHETTSALASAHTDDM